MRAERIESGTAIALTDRGRALNDARRFADAVPLLRRAIAAAPQDSTPRRLLSWSLLHLHQPSEALREADQAIALDPENGLGHRNRALILHALRRFPDALRSAREAVRLAPAECVSLHTLIESELNNGRIKDATVTAERLRDLAPDWFYTHDILALVHWHRRDWKAMEDAARKALELDPEASTAMYFLGMAHVNLKRRKEAIATLYEAARLEPSNAKIRRQLQLLVDEHTTGAGVFAAALLAALLGGPALSQEVPSLNPWLLTVMCVLLVIASVFVARRIQQDRLRQLDPPVASLYHAENERTNRPLRALGGWMLGLTASIVGGMFALSVIGQSDRSGHAAPWYTLPLGLVSLGSLITILAMLRRREPSSKRNERQRE